MKVKTKVKAGGIHFNHNLTVRRQSRVKEGFMKVKTKVRTGSLSDNHNVTVKHVNCA